jgi:NADH-quinone oxidoreductase subunit N
MGFALVGLAAASREGVQGLVVYAIVYLVMTLGAFACVIAMRRKGRQLEDISDLAGLGRSDRTLALILAILMFSLAGIPPLAGFFGKYFVFMAAVKSGLWLLAILGVLASVVAAFYYLRIVKIMYFDEPAENFEPAPSEVRLVAAASGVFTLVFAAFAGWLVDLAGAAAASLL